MTTTTKFKAGDKVRFLKTINPDWWFKPGQMGTVEYVSTGLRSRLGITVRVDTPSVFTRHAHVGPEHIELVTETDPKALKVGDVVRFKDSPEDQRVRRMFDPSSTKDTVFVISATGRWDTLKLNCKHGGYFRTRFDLVKAAPEPAIKGFHARTLILDEVAPAPKKGAPAQSHIVIAKNSKGLLKPSSEPFVHTTKAAAEKEASRLAKENPGQTFVVFSSANEASAPAPHVTITQHAAA
ncbi:hypothetical protein EJV44_15405 [Ancylobacter aquaticus]|nr:hypothetical protein EJV44_15405 [Ancylobacter aquaticus]